MNDNWISVEDELPSVFETVMIYYKKGVSIGQHVKYPDDEFWTCHLECVDYVDVTHWQPLPNPPKEND